MGGGFHNTTGETGTQLQRLEDLVSKQDLYVINIYLSSKTGLTAYEVFEIVRERKDKRLSQQLRNQMDDFMNYALTEGSAQMIAKRIKDFIIKRDKDNQVSLISIRRSITNLMDAGYLIKTDQKRKGATGRNNHVYEISAQTQDLDHERSVHTGSGRPADQQRH
jgi:Fe2+ or Zn2+ uptake regulation protein